MRRAERFLIDSLPVAGRIVPGKMEREDRPLLPIEALRETLANAFVHRDYAMGGGSVGVALYDDRLEIISTGELHFGLTPESLLREHESRPWNPMIAQTFYRRGIIETWGRGTLKVAGLMRDAGLEPPMVTVRGGSVVVTFDLNAARKVLGLDSTTQVTTQVAELLGAIDGEQTREELQEALGLANREHFRKAYLVPALDANLLERTIPDKPQSRLQRYRLTPVGRQWLAEHGTEGSDP